VVGGSSRGSLHGRTPLADRGFIKAVALLWLAGTGLRLTILAVPPIVPIIAQDLQLPATGVGLLVSSPVVLFSLAAIPGSLLIARLGAFPTVVAGLLVVAIGGALRGLAPTALPLYIATMIMGAGVAVMQPAMPSLVRQWLPRRVGFGTAVYTNGLLAGEVLPVLLTIPFVMPLVGADWRMALVIWSIPVAATALLVGVFGQRTTVTASEGPQVPRRWWPDWKDPLIWQLAALMGSINSMYFAANAFLPGYLESVGRPDLTSSALTALNFGQIPASFALLAVASRLERQSWPFIAIGLASVVCLGGMVFTSGEWIVLWTGLYGLIGAGALILALTLPPLLCPPEDVARTAAAMFTVSYTAAVVISTVSGAVWDLTGIPALAFGPIALCALVLAGAALNLRMTKRLL